MARILSFVGAKGGTLKTASVAAVAHLTAQAGLRVMMVDLDPQGDLTSRHGFERVDNPLSAPPVRVRFPGEAESELWLLRGGRAMEGVAHPFIAQHLRDLGGMQPDLVLVDTPPALGVPTRAAIEASQMIIIPAMPGKESLLRTDDIIRIANEAASRPVVRILLTMAHLQSNVLRWMQMHTDSLYPGMRMEAVVPFEMAANESAIIDRPVTLVAPQSKSALAYCDVAAEVLGRLRVGASKARTEVATV